MLRILAEARPEAVWAIKFIAAVVAVFVLYVGIAMACTLCAADDDRRKACYRVFRDLLDLFRDILELCRRRGRR